MTCRARFARLFVEEGEAFAALERQLCRKDDAMNTQTSTVTNTPAPGADAHVAPVEAWDSIAAGYDEFVAPGEARIAKAAFELVGLARDARFLDVAAGTGGLSLPAARLGARVTATDWSPKMIERFESRVREERLVGAEGRVMDCHALDFADDTFDVTGSLFGVMLVPDQPKALREMVRVTKRGGRVLLIAYGSPSEFEAVHVFLDALGAVDPTFEGLPSDPPPLEFQVSDPEAMKQRLLAAGLRDVRVDTTHREVIEIRSGRDLWNWCLGSNPIPNMLVADLDEAKKASLREHIDVALRARADRRGVAVLTAPLNIGIGTK
jgi:ubiquinone/menaquinone biosynthesis C-methylase UbiE